MDTTKEYLDAMNQLDKQLESEDRKYFNDLRAYMTTASFFKEEQSVNEQLYQMYLDFLNAEEEGFSAEEFFGNNPKEMADQLLEQLPKTSFKTLLGYVGIAAVNLWSIRIVFDFSHSIDVVINPAIYLFDLVLVFTLVLLLFKLIQSSVYRKSTRKMNFIEAIGAGLIFLFYGIIYLRAEQFIPDILAFPIPFPVDVIFIIGISLAAIILIIKSKEKVFYGTAFILFIPILNGISLRLEDIGGVTIPGVFKLVTVVALGIVFIMVVRKLNKN